MTDQDLRSHERSAASGDPQAKAALLRHRVRTREVDRLGPWCQERVEFLAYLGHEGARWIEKDGWNTGTFSRWLAGVQALARKWITGERECGPCEGKGHVDGWNGDQFVCERCEHHDGAGKVPTTAEEPAMLRAAVAAAWMVYEYWAPGDRIEWIHAEEHLQEHKLEAFRRAYDALVFAQRYIDDPTEGNREAWSRAMESVPVFVPDPEDSIEALAVRILRAAEIIGESSTCQVISTALVEWTLVKEQA